MPVIELDSPLAKEVGFTSDKFEGWMWKQRKTMHISFIISKQPGTGNFTRLLDALFARGYTVKIPTPSRTMRCICSKRGFVLVNEFEDTIQERVMYLVGKPGK